MTLDQRWRLWKGLVAALLVLIAPDPVLAGAVVASARRQRTGHALFLASGAIPVGVRLSHLLAGDAGAGGAFDTVVILVWLVLAVFLTRGLVRTTKAISANR